VLNHLYERLKPYKLEQALFVPDYVALFKDSLMMMDTIIGLKLKVY